MSTPETKIQNVINRLESGEKLICDGLRKGDNFCILGLFADESGLGEWGNESYSDAFWTYATKISHNYFKLVAYELPANVVEYFNLVDQTGAFYVADLPDEILAKMVRLGVHAGSEILALSEINDYMLKSEHKDETNQLLAEIIKSGVVFVKA